MCVFVRKRERRGEVVVPGGINGFVILSVFAKIHTHPSQLKRPIPEDANMVGLRRKLSYTTSSSVLIALGGGGLVTVGVGPNITVVELTLKTAIDGLAQFHKPSGFQVSMQQRISEAFNKVSK